MATCTLTLKVKVAWWLKPYCYTLAAFCAITGCEPNWDKVKRVINRAVTIKHVP